MNDYAFFAIVIICYTLYACWNRYLSHKEKTK